MDSIRNLSITGVAQFVVLSALSPVMADLGEDDWKEHLPHGHSQIHAVSHSRADYPVIWNWISSPDQVDESVNPQK